MMVELDDGAPLVVPVLLLPAANRQHMVEANSDILLPEPQHWLQIVCRKSDVDDVFCISLALLDKQIELVQTFADQAVIAIENARLFDEVQARTRELTKSLEELRTTQDRLVQTQKLALLGHQTCRAASGAAGQI